VVNDDEQNPERPTPAQPIPELTPESADALAENVISTGGIPKKIPALDDEAAQIAAVGGAIGSALLTATDMPLHTLQPFVGKLAKQMVAYGIRQTEFVDLDAVHAPAWITDGIRQESVVVPPQADHVDAEPMEARTAEAPACPSRIKASARAVRL
jgi:hypothetical protein